MATLAQAMLAPVTSVLGRLLATGPNNVAYQKTYGGWPSPEFVQHLAYAHRRLEDRREGLAKELGVADEAEAQSKKAAPKNRFNKRTVGAKGGTYQADVGRERQTRREAVAGEMEALKDEIEMIGYDGPDHDEMPLSEGHATLMALSPFSAGTMTWYPGVIAMLSERENQRIQQQLGIGGVLFL